MSTQKDMTVRELNERLYDILMGVIEPDLTLEMLPILDEIYKDETAEQHEARMKRYALAMVEFKKRSKKFTQDVKAELSNIKNRAVTFAKNANTTQEKMNVDSIAQSLEQS